MFETLPTWQIYLFVGMLFTFLVAGGVTAIIITMRLRWRYKVVILENLNGQGYTISGRDRARLVAFGDGGEEVYLLKKRKKYRVGYGRKIAHNNIAWAIGADGYWYNITFGNLDKKLSEIGVMPIDRDMRFANSAIRKGIETRYNQKGFMEKYGTIIAFGMLFLCIVAVLAGAYYNSKKQIELRKTDIEVMKTNKEVTTDLKAILSQINLKTGGSGAAPVTNIPVSTVEVTQVP